MYVRRLYFDMQTIYEAVGGYEGLLKLAESLARSSVTTAWFKVTGNDS